MTEYKGYERLVSDLAAMHGQALEQVEPDLHQLRARFQACVQQAASTSRRRDRETETGLTFRAAFGRPLTLLAASGAALGVAALVGVAFVRRPVMKVVVSPEPSSAIAGIGAALPIAGAASPAVADPCIYHVTAKGDQPLIDDFEDGNPIISTFENRVGFWGLFKDTDSSGTFLPLMPAPRPQPTRENRIALHAVGGELRSWGATVQFAFQPSCYDASVYAGIAFSAKGPGRFYVGVREVRVVPVQWGGTCMHDCYDTHQKKVDLSAHWQQFSLKWGELRQRGYNSPPLDTTRINSFGFLIQSGDTPFDIWLDDVKFIAR
jgi:hypothetical protein